MLRRRIPTLPIGIHFIAGLADAKDYSESVVGSCFSNICAITHLARKQNFLAEDPGEDVIMPLTKRSRKLVMSLEQILSLLGAITDLHDLCLMLVASSADHAPAR